MKQSTDISTAIKRMVVDFTNTFGIKTKNITVEVMIIKLEGVSIDRVMIDKRPKIVEKKNRIGDLEIDIVISKDHKGFLVTVVDKNQSLYSSKMFQPKKLKLSLKLL